MKKLKISYVKFPGWDANETGVLPKKNDILKACIFESFFLELVFKTIIVPYSKVVYQNFLIELRVIRYTFHFTLIYYILYWCIYCPLYYLLNPFIKIFSTILTYTINNVPLNVIVLWAATLIYALCNYLTTHNSLHFYFKMSVISIWYNFWFTHSFIITILISLLIFKYR